MNPFKQQRNSKVYPNLNNTSIWESSRKNSYKLDRSGIGSRIEKKRPEIPAFQNYFRPFHTKRKSLMKTLDTSDRKDLKSKKSRIFSHDDAQNRKPPGLTLNQNRLLIKSERKTWGRNSKAKQLQVQ